MKKQRYIISHASPLGHYAAQAFVVRCFDERFRAACEKFLAREKIKKADVESVAGGAKIFSSPEKAGDRDFMLRELEKSIKLHHTKRVMLFTHYDCGAYGGIVRFDGDEEKQFSFHQTELRKAAAEVRQKFPDLAVETYFMDKEGIA
ncbi:MAG: carbonic anhydrase, partial [Patescibacteria group bacterium]